MPAPNVFVLAASVVAAEYAPLACAICVVSLVASLAWPRRSLRFVCVAASLAAIALTIVPLAFLDRTIQKSTAIVDRATGLSAGSGETAASAPFELARILTSAPAPGVRVRDDLPVRCADGTRLGLDVYESPLPGPRPTAIFIYGGAWQFGRRANVAPLAREFAGLGYTSIAVDYRHAPAYRFPVQRDDVRAALVAIARHARRWNVDPARVALIGESAGAELALLSAYEPGPLHVRAVVGFYAPLDLAGGYRTPPRPDPADVRGILRTYLGGSPEARPAAYAAASPRSFVRKHLPPTLLVGGVRDQLVDIRFQRAMAAALAAGGNRVASLEFPWSNHGFMTLAGGLGGQLGRYYAERFVWESLR